MMWRRTMFIVVAVVVMLILELRICCSLKTNESSTNTGIARNAQRWDYQTNSQGSKGKTELLGKRQFRRGVGDEVNALKDKAKKASSVYKWLKKNWQKMVIIVLAIFALIVVVGIYRRCFSDSSSNGDDEEPNIVVVRMLKQDNKENKETVDAATVMEEVTQGSGDIGKKGATVGHGTNNTGHTGGTASTTIEKSSAGGKVYKETSSALVTTCVKRQSIEKAMSVKHAGFPAISSKPDLQEVKFPGFLLPMNSIPISGYSTFQQIDCYKVYVNFNQYIFNVKTMADQLKVQPTMVCQGSTSEGPFPFYEEIPLIKNVMASLMLKCCDGYIPTASTNTSLLLTVSP